MPLIPIPKCLAEIDEPVTLTLVQKPENITLPVAEEITLFTLVDIVKPVTPQRIQETASFSSPLVPQDSIQTPVAMVRNELSMNCEIVTGEDLPGLWPSIVEQSSSPTGEPVAVVPNRDNEQNTPNNGPAMSISFSTLIHDDPMVDHQLSHSGCLKRLSSRELEWPSARDILAAHSSSPASHLVPSVGRKKKTKKIKVAAVNPTRSCAPSQWMLPIFLIGPVLVVFILASGILGCSLAWRWVGDSYIAAVATDRLLMTDRSSQRRPLPDSVRPPEGSWMVSTAGHLTRWAIFRNRFAGEDKQSAEETAALLVQALAVSPINAEARLALAQLESDGKANSLSALSVGLSRDAFSLAWMPDSSFRQGKRKLL